MLRAPLPTTLNYYLAIHSNDSFWTVQKDQASLSAVLPTTPRRPVQTGRLRLLGSERHHGVLDRHLDAVLQDRLALGHLGQGELAALLVKLLKTIKAVPRIPHDLAGLADVAELFGQLQQANLGPDHLAFCGHPSAPR